MSDFDFFHLTDAQRAQALAYGQFARAEAAKIPDIPADTAPRALGSVAVVGAGTMGGGIAMALAAIDLPVVLIDASAEGLARGLARMKDNYAISVKRGKLTQAQVEQRLALVRGSVRLEDARDVDLVIEAVFEDMDLKRELFAKLDAICQPGAILASNTSGLDVNQIAAATQRPTQVIGAHFFSPAHVMRLLEVVRADQTAPDVIATLMALGRRMGKVAVLARVYPGFIGNALFRTYTREAHLLVEDGALPHQVDAALCRFGYAMGVFAVHDMSGNDVGYKHRKALIATRPNDRRYSDLILKLCDQGRLGQKSGKGWYRYEPGDRTPLRDPELERFIVEESARMGIVRRPMDESEILKRCLYSIINEGAKLLELGIAQRPSDVNVTYLTGYGFPEHQGGPLYLADRIGLPQVLADIRRLHAELGLWWRPAPLLERLVQEGRCFADLQA
jgi:3-hydroxyacyl-CoA dehydrogenase